MPDNTRKTEERAQDKAVAETFPASDPPASMGGEGHARAVPPEEMMAAQHKRPHDAVTLRRRFPTTEAAKLAVESVVRDGPVDRSCTEMVAKDREVEVLLHVPEEDCHRIRSLLARA
jgi:hypothetical protein